MRSVLISVLGLTFEVRCDSERWASFIEILWDPALGSLGEAQDVRIEIANAGSKWNLFYGDYLHISEDPWVIASTIRNFVSMQALRLAQGIVSLHAASAIVDGSVLLLAGPSEAGKTTLLLDLIAGGWSPSGDDLAVVSPDASTITTFPKPLHVRDPARWGLFRERWDPPGWVPDPVTSGLLPPRAVGMVAGTYPPIGVLFPVFDPAAKPRLESMTPAEASAMCALHCQNPGGADPSALAIFAKLGRDTPCARLTYPSSKEAMGLLGRFFQDFAGIPGIA